VIDPGEAVFDAILLAAHLEHVGDEPCCGAIGVTRWQAELDAIVRQDRVDLVGHCLDESGEEGRGGDAVGLVHQPDEGELAGPVDGNEEIELSFGGLHLGDVDVEEADGIGLEFLFGRSLPLHLGQTGNPVTLQTAMQ